MRRLVCLGAALAAASVAPAFAAGFALKEHSTDAMAAAYAGAAATDSDPTYMAYNPAATAGVRDTDYAVSAVIILPGSRGTYSSATTSAGNPTGGGLNPSGYISGAQVPSFGVRHRLSDRFSIGLDVHAPFGLKTDYRTGWAGRYYGEKTQFLSIDAVPSIAYQMSPELTLGAGAQIEWAQGTLTSMIDTGTLGAANGIPGSIPGAQDTFAHLSGKSWAFGWTVGAIWRPRPDLSLGLSYHSAMDQDLRGPLTFTLDSAGIGATIRAVTGALADTRQTTRVSLPDIVNFGAREDFSDAWSGMAELDYTHWSRFQQIRVVADNPAQPDDITTTRWHDTFFGSLGLEYRPCRGWAIRAGAGFDESPVPDATREPRIPDAGRIWLSAGVRTRLSDDLDLNVTASRLIFLGSDVALTPALPGGALRGSLSGETESYANVAAFQFTWRPD